MGLAYRLSSGMAKRVSIWEMAAEKLDAQRCTVSYEADNRADGGPMLQRFVSASVVASIGIAFGAVALLIASHIWALQNIHKITLLWCCVPLAWGIWATLTPRTWMPERLPIWGALLGLLASGAVLIVLNLPLSIIGKDVTWLYRAAGVLFAVVGYYLLWMLVRVVYRALRGPELAEREFRTAA